MTVALLLASILIGSAPAKVHVHYTLRVDTSTHGAFDVTMSVTGMPNEFIVAAAAHLLVLSTARKRAGGGGTAGDREWLRHLRLSEQSRQAVA